MAYTDIDYTIYTDAAQHIVDGRSPYDRHTYRYTPFLALLLSYLPFHEAGRYLFCLADAVCGQIILDLQQQQQDKRQPSRDGLSKTASSSSRPVQTFRVFWWMYNPLAINICTRGSAESLMVLLPVLITLRLLQSNRPTLAGLVHGLAIHSKLYPLIYTLSFMVYLGGKQSSNDTRQERQQQNKSPPAWIIAFVVGWIKRLLFQSAPMLFLMSTILSFTGLTYASVEAFGMRALQEGLLYHFSRVDHRHNYAMHWYGMYLSRAREAAATATAMTTIHNNDNNSSTDSAVYWMLGQGFVGKYMLFLFPQAVLLLYTSLCMASRHLGLTLFVQTFLFVTLNKVITAQYFTWYLCLLPLCSSVLSFTRSVQWALVWLGVSIVSWLACAYGLEMAGLSIYRLVWMASIQYFLANVNLLAALIESYREDASSNSGDKERTTKDDVNDKND